MRLYAWYGHAINTKESMIHPAGGYVVAESEDHALGMAYGFCNQELKRIGLNASSPVVRVRRIPLDDISAVTE